MRDWGLSKGLEIRGLQLYLQLLRGLVHLCYFSTLEMDGKHSMWEPWYLDVMMATMAPDKVQCKFCDLQFIYCKDMMFNHLGYHPSGGGKGGVGLCAEARPRMKALFARCGGNVPTTLDNAQASSSLLDIHVPNLVNNKSLKFL